MKLSHAKALYLIAFTLIINTIVYRVTYVQYIRASLLLILQVYYIIHNIHKGFVIKKGAISYVIVFLVLEGYSTIKGKQSIVGFFGSTMVIILISIIVMTCSEKKFNIFLETLCQISLVYLYINAVFAIIFPGGLSKVSNEWGWSTGIYLLGQNINLYLFVIIPFISAFCLEEYYGNKKYVNPTIFVLFLYIYLGFIGFAESETTFALSCLILAFFSILYQKKRINFRIPAVLTLIVIMIVFVGIVFSGNLLKSPVFVFLIENVLHKSINITGRTYIWNNALWAIAQEPIFGYGVGAQVITYIQGVFVSEHNQVLHILIEGGLVALFFFLVANVKFAIETKKIQNNKISNVIMIAYIAVAIIFLTGAFGLASSWEIYFLFVITDYLVKFDSKKRGIL